MKNARQHSPLDLATAPEVKDLIVKARSTKKCVLCSSKFDFKNIRYYCDSCSRFFCINCSYSQWVYEDKDSEEKERPVCRCLTCYKRIQESEENLRQAMATMDFHTVDRALHAIISNSIDIDVKLRHDADVCHLKLERELDIRKFIESVAFVEDYKTILKSVKILNDKVEAAKELNVEID